MKYLSLLFTLCLLQGCINVASFQPPLPTDSWYLSNVAEHFDLTTTEGMIAYSKKEAKDMRACGIDPVIGESLSAKSGLCMESKGWYEKKGPVCEDSMFYNDPLCVKWRAKHKR